MTRHDGRSCDARCDHCVKYAGSGPHACCVATRHPPVCPIAMLRMSARGKGTLRVLLQDSMTAKSAGRRSPRWGRRLFVGFPCCAAAGRR